ncbi:MAG TPA: 4-alpha-glucanotransferase [Candidatus Aminicenantes bacterium]|nr:4-alpha-glucanotransferase [Candidatus Aminicenantes bacterium]
MNDPLGREQRSSGLLLHITSLPGRFGIGTLGREAEAFLEQLVRAGQSAWQVLPLNPTSSVFGYSPYASPSALAGNPLLIDLESIQAESWCPDLELSSLEVPAAGRVDFAAAERCGCRLETAFRGFCKSAPLRDRDAFNEFKKNQAGWLDDYALFTCFCRRFQTGHWLDWPEEIRVRDPRALAVARRDHEAETETVVFRQFLFERQWLKLKESAEQHGVRLIGDIPIYVNLDSADAWAHPEIFDLDQRTRKPGAVAGVPPDYFSATGQLWGNPLYNWFNGSSLNQAVLHWWENRMRRMLEWFHLVRLDHFRAFAKYWAVPADSRTAECGQWRPGPGSAFFQSMQKRLGPLPLIAEDLGEITPDVEALRDELELPGMKILQFAFDGDPGNIHLPHNYSSPCCVVYPGTHDNNTVNGWFYGPELDDASRKRVMEYVGAGNPHDMHWNIIRLALQSIARLAVIPVQDVLGFGADCRMNTPGRASGNWAWQLKPQDLNPGVLDWLAHLTRVYGRA